MKLHNLPKLVEPSKKRLGRGHGSGRVKTAGRGTKGQKARGKIKPAFEGGQLPLIKKLPLQRGKGRNKALRHGPVIVNVKYLNLLSKDSEVTIETLIKAGIIKNDEARSLGVKILGDGELKIPLKVNLPCSNGARAKIEKAGGEIIQNSKGKNQKFK